MQKEIVSFAAAFILNAPHVLAQEQISSSVITEEQQRLQQGRTIVEQLRDIEIRVFGETNALGPLTSGDGERIEMLDRDLQLFPETFYKDVQFILYPNWPGANCRCHIDALDGKDRIDLGEGGFRPEFELEAFQQLGHEFGHRIIPVTLIDRQADDKRTLASPWFDQIDEILSGSFSERRLQIRDLILQRYPYMQDLRQRARRYDFIWTDEQKEDKFLYNILYGVDNQTIDKDYPLEFIANLVVHFRLGNDYFFRMYGMVFDEETVENLHQFIKNDAYGGIEYVDLELN